jgi:hypothetical protein
VIKINWQEWDWEEIIDRAIQIGVAMVMLGLGLLTLLGCIMLILTLIIGGN